MKYFFLKNITFNGAGYSVFKLVRLELEIHLSGSFVWLLTLDTPVLKPGHIRVGKMSINRKDKLRFYLSVALLLIFILLWRCEQCTVCSARRPRRILWLAALLCDEKWNGQVNFSNNKLLSSCWERAEGNLILDLITQLHLLVLIIECGYHGYYIFY